MDEDLLLLMENSYLKWKLQYMKFGTHDLNKGREEFGEFYVLYADLRTYPDKFFEYTRMSLYTFDYILNKISPFLIKTDTNFRKSIKPEEKLLITIR